MVSINGSNEEIRQFVLSHIERISGHEIPRSNEALKLHLRDDLGLDSLDQMALFFDIQEHLGIGIPEHDVVEYDLLDVANLLNFLDANAVADEIDREA